MLCEFEHHVAQTNQAVKLFAFWTSLTTSVAQYALIFRRRSLSHIDYLTALVRVTYLCTETILYFHLLIYSPLFHWWRNRMQSNTEHARGSVVLEGAVHVLGGSYRKGVEGALPYENGVGILWTRMVAARLQEYRLLWHWAHMKRRSKLQYWFINITNEIAALERSSWAVRVCSILWWRHAINIRKAEPMGSCRTERCILIPGSVKLQQSTKPGLSERCLKASSPAGSRFLGYGEAKEFEVWLFPPTCWVSRIRSDLVIDVAGRE